MGTTGTICLLLARKDAKLKTRIYHPEQPQKHFWELCFWVSMTRERRTESATSKHKVPAFIFSASPHTALCLGKQRHHSEKQTSNCLLLNLCLRQASGGDLGQGQLHRVAPSVVALLPSLPRGSNWELFPTEPLQNLHKDTHPAFICFLRDPQTIRYSQPEWQG